MSATSLQSILFGAAFAEALSTQPEANPPPTSSQSMPHTTAALKFGEQQLTDGPTPPTKHITAAVIVGCLHRHDTSELRRTAQNAFAHCPPPTQAAGLAWAHVVQSALEGVPPPEYLSRALLITDGISETFDAVLYRVGQAHFASEEHALRHIGTTDRDEEVFARALWCVAQYPTDYVACVRRAATAGSPATKTAYIAGAISAAWLGLDAVPVGWRSRCAHRQRIVDLSEQMFLNGGDTNP